MGVYFFASFLECCFRSWRHLWKSLSWALMLENIESVSEILDTSSPGSASISRAVFIVVGIILGWKTVEE
jgi:hypothetical protein